MNIKSMFNKVVSCFTNCCGDWTAPKSTELNIHDGRDFYTIEHFVKNRSGNDYQENLPENSISHFPRRNNEKVVKEVLKSNFQKIKKNKNVSNAQEFQLVSENLSSKSSFKIENVIPRKNEKLNSSSNASKGVSKTSHRRDHAILIGDKKNLYEESNKYFKKFNSAALDERCKELADALSESQTGSLVQIFNKDGQHYLTIQRITKNSDELYELHCNSMEFTKAQVEDGYNTNPVPYSALSKAAKYEIIQPAEKEA